MARRVNVMIDDEAWGILEKLPRGERSRAVNRAILEWAHARKRRDAALRMDAIAEELPAVSTREIVRWLRADRERNTS